MLKLKYLFENYDLAKKCLELYEYDKESVDEMIPQFRISSNAIYPFRARKDVNKICCLRLSPAEEKLISDVISEIRLIKWLIEKEFPAMRPVPMKSGEFTKRVHTEWGIFNVSCFEKVPGINLEDIDGTLQIVRGYGRTLGKLHALMKEYPYPQDRRNHKSLLEEIDNRLREYDAPESVKREFMYVKEGLEQLNISSTNYGVIHYDFEPDNVFYDVGTDTFSVIDFDDMIQCWYALDVVRAIDALDDVIEGPEFGLAEKNFLEGYQSVTPFIEEQMKSLPLMRRLVHLQEYATLLYVMSEPVDEKPDWMKQLVVKLTFKLKKLEESMTMMQLQRD